MAEEAATRPANGAARRRPFLVVLVGQSVSAAGDAFSNVAMPLLVLRLTGSVTQMGVVSGISTLGQLIGGIVAGPFVDRHDRRRTLLACDWFQLLLGLSIPVGFALLPAGGPGRALMPLIIAVVAISSVLVSLSSVGLRAVTPMLVPTDQVGKANGQLTAATEVAYGIGPVLAGFAVAAIGEPTAIGINALTYGVSAVCWHLVRTRPAPEPEEPTEAEAEAVAGRTTGGSVRAWLADLTAGLAFLHRSARQRAFAVLDTLNSFAVAAATVLFIYFVQRTFGAGSAVVGLLLTLGSVGAVAASLIVPLVQKRLGPGPVYLLAIAGEGVALIGAGVAGSLVAVGALAAVFACGQVGAAIISLTYRQQHTPPQLMGRVIAAVLVLQQGARILGISVETTAADQIGIRPVFVGLGTLCLLIMVAGLFTPVRRREPEVSTPN